MAEPIIIIPARLASMRLPDKPLLDIGGAPMIVRVWERACAANCGRVVVAAGDQEIYDVVVAAGGEAVMTDADLPSGSDRIYQALQRVDTDGQHDIIINLQGDLPNLAPSMITDVEQALLAGGDMASLVAEITDPSEYDDPNCVKAVISWQDTTARLGRALYFTRATAPYGEGPLYHHIGIYAYQRQSLARFVSLPPSELEKRERLEQLRALEAGMVIQMARVDAVPLGVDTPADLEKARAYFKTDTVRELS